MFHVEAHVTIARPIDDVSRFLSNPQNEAQWHEGVLSQTLVSGVPGIVGARYKRIFQARGKPHEALVELTEINPRHKIVLRSDPGPVQVTATLQLEAVPEGTQVTSVADVQTQGFTRLMRPFIAMDFKRAVRGNLQTLKRLLESPLAAEPPLASGSASTAPPSSLSPKKATQKK